MIGIEKNGDKAAWDHVLKKMCEYVGADFDKIDIKEEGWYEKYEWSEEQEDGFIEWLANEIRTNNKIRKGITTLSYRPTRAKAEAYASWFVAFCGWKTKKEV